MRKSYVIRWKSKVNGRIGKGSRQFEREEAEMLAAELNAEYPEIEHEVVDAGDERHSGSVEQTEERPREHALSR
jgi:hypothetical protein